MVTYHPHKLLQPESCLSSQRRHVAVVQVQQRHALIPGWGLCSPRCECPTTSHPLMYIWKRRMLLIPKIFLRRFSGEERNEKRIKHHSVDFIRLRSMALQHRKVSLILLSFMLDLYQHNSTNFSSVIPDLRC